MGEDAGRAPVDTVSLWALQPGDIGFGPIGGLTGLLVGVGQVLLGDESRFRHVFVVTEGVPHHRPR